MCPTLHLFDRERLKFWGGVLLVGNIVLGVGCVFVLYSVDEKTLVLTAAQVKSSILLYVITLILYSGFVVYINTLTSQVYDDVKKTNETIEAANREKEQFYATMSHEIRNPLQSLQGSVDLMSELSRANSSSSSPTTTAQLSEELPPLLEICRGCCGIVINLVSNLLDMSKIAADMMQLSPVPTDLRELTNRILKISRGRAEGKGVRLELVCDPQFPPAVEADPQRVEQVLVNLVSNAIKFTPSKGRIVVRLSWLPLISPAVADTLRLALSSSSWAQTIEFEEKLQENKSLPASSVHEHRRCTISCCPSARAIRSGDTSTASNLGESQRPLREGIAKVEVMDSGIGIDKDSTAKLFKAYQQADASISRFASASEYDYG